MSALTPLVHQFGDQFGDITGPSGAGELGEQPHLPGSQQGERLLRSDDRVDQFRTGQGTRVHLRDRAHRLGAACSGGELRPRLSAERRRVTRRRRSLGPAGNVIPCTHRAHPPEFD